MLATDNNTGSGLTNIQI